MWMDWVLIVRRIRHTTRNSHPDWLQSVMTDQRMLWQEREKKITNRKYERLNRNSIAKTDWLSEIQKGTVPDLFFQQSFWWNGIHPDVCLPAGCHQRSAPGRLNTKHREYQCDH